MTEAEYHAHPAMSYSKLKVLIDNPREYWVKHVAKIIPDSNTSSKELGTCLDLALTNSEAYKQLKVKNTKTTSVEGYITEYWQSQINLWVADIYKYKMVLPEFQTVASYLTLEQIIKSCINQEKIFWADEKTGEDCRAMLDWHFFNNGLCFLIDLKSTKAKTYQKFMKDFEDYHYYLQAAKYSTALRIKYNLNYYPPAYYVAISTATGEIFVVKVSDQMLTYGLMEMDYGLAFYQRCKQTNEWAINKPPVVAELSPWTINKILNQYQSIFNEVA